MFGFEHQSCRDELHYLLLLLITVFDMIGGLILVSHAPKRWYSAGGFWRCDNEACDVALVSSPPGDCKTADPGRDRARVVLTRYNGIVSDSRFANAMGFMKYEVMSGCTTHLQSLMEEED
ncbi:putative pollen allergen Ole e 1 family [Helianthus debilis subsp. tardiflorus]